MESLDNVKEIDLCQFENDLFILISFFLLKTL